MSQKVRAVETKQEEHDVGQVTYAHSDDIGIVLYEVGGEEPTYEFGGDELYVRAKVVSTKISTNPSRPGSVEVAWTQPVPPM